MVMCQPHMEGQSNDNAKRHGVIVLITNSDREVIIVLNLSGSLRYDMNGRKRKAYKKNNPTVKKQRVSAKSFTPVTPDRIKDIQDHYDKYPSFTSPAGKGKGTLNSKWQAEKQEISKGYTVAPAYNKGAYQVIGKNNIKDIGK